MKDLIIIVKDNRHFFFPWLLMILLSLILLMTFSKTTLFLWINGNNSPWADKAFYYLTPLGNGWIYLPLFVLSLFFSWRYALIVISAVIIQSLLVYVLKQIIFSDIVRPIRFFEDSGIIHFVEGVKVHGSRSFPSGHTITAFGVFTMLALMLKNKKAGIIMLLAASLAAYSRVYLAQHFFADIVAGSIIGVLSSLLCYTILINRKIEKLKKLDKGLNFLKMG